MLKKAKLINKNCATNNVTEFTFLADEDFIFTPGQFINISIEDKQDFPCFRAYSISSDPKEKTFSLCVKVVENGRGSNWLNNLKLGSTIRFLGPIGNFYYKQNKNDICFICTGTGIAPFKSMIPEILKAEHKKKVTLIEGVRTQKDILYEKFFSELGKKYKNFSFLVTLSGEPDNKNYQQGRVTQNLEKYLNPNLDYYLCGTKPMIEDCIKIFSENLIKKENIFFEKF